MATACPTWAAWAAWTCNSAQAEPSRSGKGPQGPFSFVSAFVSLRRSLALQPARGLRPERLRGAAPEKAEVADALQAGVARRDHALLRRDLRQMFFKEPPGAALGCEAVVG